MNDVGGPVPQHLAFIMDGNRRYARKNNREIAEGHTLGGMKLKETLEWCFELGIKTVSAFAFSIENFKRDKSEVDTLMSIAKQKLAQFLPDLVHRTKIQLIGDITLLPPDLQQVVAEAIFKSKNTNTGFILNICFGYTSTDEIRRATIEIANGVKRGMISPSDISASLLSQSLDTYNCSDPDMIIRTSGEIRLSDFMLWQGAYSYFTFFDVLWPEFSVYHLYLAILQYHLYYPEYQKRRKNFEIRQEKILEQQDKILACQRLAQRKGLPLPNFDCLSQTSSDVQVDLAVDSLSFPSATTNQNHIFEIFSGSSQENQLFPFDPSEIEKTVKEIQKERKTRVDAFLHYVHQQRENLMEQILRSSTCAK